MPECQYMPYRVYVAGYGAESIAPQYHGLCVLIITHIARRRRSVSFMQYCCWWLRYETAIAAHQILLLRHIYAAAAVMELYYYATFSKWNAHQPAHTIYNDLLRDMMTFSRADIFSIISILLLFDMQMWFLYFCTFDDCFIYDAHIWLFLRWLP